MFLPLASTKLPMQAGFESMNNDPLENTPFERVPTVYSAADIRQLVEQPAKDVGIAVGKLEGTEFYLTRYVDGPADLLIDVTNDQKHGAVIRRQISVSMSSGEQVRHETIDPLLVLRIDTSGCPIALIERTPLTESELIREILRPLMELATH
jgi:hypothetical protein